MKKTPFLQRRIEQENPKLTAAGEKNSLTYHRTQKKQVFDELKSI